MFCQAFNNVIFTESDINHKYFFDWHNRVRLENFIQKFLNVLQNRHS